MEQTNKRSPLTVVVAHRRRARPHWQVWLWRRSALRRPRTGVSLTHGMDLTKRQAEALAGVVAGQLDAWWGHARDLRTAV